MSLALIGKKNLLLEAKTKDKWVLCDQGTPPPEKMYVQTSQEID